MPELAQRRAVRFDPQMLGRIPLHLIGGGKVTRPFRMGDKLLKAGTTFTGDQIRALPAANRQVLLDRFISVWPMPDGDVAHAASIGTERAERHVVPLGFGRYDVVHGTKVNDEPVDRETAYKLAGKAAPVGQNRAKH